MECTARAPVIPERCSTTLPNDIRTQQRHFYDRRREISREDNCRASTFLELTCLVRVTCLQCSRHLGVGHSIGICSSAPYLSIRQPSHLGPDGEGTLFRCGEAEITLHLQLLDCRLVGDQVEASRDGGDG